MPVRVTTDELRRRAEQIDAELANLHRMGRDAVGPIATRAQAAVVRAVRTGGDPVEEVRRSLAPLEDLVRRALVAAHLQGRLRSVRAVEQWRARREAIGMGAARDQYEGAVQFLKRRLELSGEQLAALEQTYSPQALRVVSGATDVAEQQVGAAVLESVRRGETVRDGARRVERAFADAGVAPSNPYRYEAIFRTQVNAAYTSGRLQANADPAIDAILWGYAYFTVGDDRVRPRHVAMDGMRLPKGDARWSTLMPPNGYGCRCQVVEVFTDEDAATTVEPPDELEVDGKVVQPVPDEGFDFNPADVYRDALPPPKLDARELVAPSDLPVPDGPVELKSADDVVAKLPGWRVVETPRPGGKRVDRQVVAPGGRKFRSFKEAERWVNERIGPVEIADADDLLARFPAWRVERRTRPNGRTDAIFHAPDGTKLRSVREVERWINEQRRLAIRLPEIPPGITPTAGGRARPPAATPPPKPSTGGFPESLDDVTKTQDLGGSTGAELVEDAAGNKFVLKRGRSAEQVREEFAAEEAYRALGVRVPESRLYETASGPAKLSRWLDGRELGKLKGAEREAAVRKLREDFAADAVLGNWDVVGMAEDNVLVDAAGQVWRIDVGGSLRFRAQGAAKSGAQWNAYPDELFSLTDAQVNASAARVFGGITHRERMASAKRVLQRGESAAEALDRANVPSAVFRARVEEVRNLDEVADAMFADRWLDGYVRGVNRHQLGLRQAGVVGRMPKRLDRKGGGVELYDEEGRRWDALRNAAGLERKRTVVDELADYVDANGGSYRSFEIWAERQSGSSWAKNPTAHKWVIARGREVPVDRYYWHHGADEARAAFQEIAKKAGGEDVLYQTVRATHAYQIEFLRAVEFPNNDRRRGLVKLIRTEAESVMRDVKPGETFVVGDVVKRGVAESFSIYRQVKVRGAVKTTQSVPHHRVFANYFHARGRTGSGRFDDAGSRTLFLTDNENEFIAFTDGIEAKRAKR